MAGKKKKSGKINKPLERVFPHNQIAEAGVAEKYKQKVVVNKNDAGSISEKTAQDLAIKLSKVEWLSAYLEKMRMADYITIMSKPRRLIWVNFLSGIARGLGFTIGFTLLGALIVYFLNQLRILNLPLIGDFISNLLEYIELSRSSYL